MVTSGGPAPGTTTLRSPWSWFVGALGLVAGLTGAATVVGGVEDAATSTTVSGLAMTAFLVFTVRAPFIRLVLTEDAVRMHGPFRTVRASRAHLTTATLEQTSGGEIFTVYAPVLHRVGDDGIVLTWLAGYSTQGRAARSRMGRQTLLLQRYCQGG